MTDKKLQSKPMKYDIFTGEPIDIGETVAKLAEQLAKTDTGAKKKMSYSISPTARELIKTIAGETGSTQGSIVEIAPLLFAKIATDSLERRAKALTALQTLHDQITRSLNAFTGLAPHLAPYTDRIKELTGELLAMEKAAVADRNFQGTDASDYPSLERLKPEPQDSPPYHREIRQFLEGTPWIAELNRD